MSSRSPRGAALSQPESIPINVGQLQHAWLARVSFRENDRFDVEAPDDLGYHVEHNHEITELDAEPAKAAVMLLHGTVEWTHVKGEEFEKPFDLSLTTAGLFVWDPSPRNPSNMQRWLELNGVYLLWPYLRSHIALITGASSLPPLTIYTLRVPDFPRTSARTTETADEHESQRAAES